jgi:ATP-dependent RNA helicase RhlE
VNALERGAVLVVATPGRLLDLMEQGHISLENIEEFVLDEADRMLDMGFLPDIKRVIAALPAERHSQFFSATLSPEVSHLAMSMVKNPVSVTISPDQPTVDKINQKVMFVDKPNKDSLLVSLLTTHPEYAKVLVFARTRHGADRIERKLETAGVRAEAIHSDKTQKARTDALNAFRKGRVRVLVATDIASRGIDVDGITHVINIDLPEETESYVHRIGRTARAGTEGAAISFVSAEERGLLRAVERMIKKEIPVEKEHEFHSERAEKAAGKGGSDQMSRPAWAQNKQRRQGGHPANAGRQHRPGSQGRNQSDFRQGHATEGGGQRPPRPERPYNNRDQPPRQNRDQPPRQEAPARDTERPPRFDDVNAERPKRPVQSPADKPRIGKPASGPGHQHEGGGFKGAPKGGAHKKRSSRPPWMM